MAKKKVRKTVSSAKPDSIPQARTIVYIHGIGNKPPPSVLKCQWDTALFGIDLGDKSRMAYWVNRAYYPEPLDETCAAGDKVEPLKALGIPGAEDLDAEIRRLAGNKKEEQWLKGMGRRILEGFKGEEEAIRAAEAEAKVLPLPDFIRRRITEALTRAFLRDVHDFFFREERRALMERSLRERLGSGGPFVVIAHSQGSMIAYEVLRKLEDCHVPLFVTIGSPLGIEEVKDMFRKWTGRKRLSVPPCVERWVNVADRLDPVALDADISNDFSPKGFIENFWDIGLNADSPWHPHSGTGYLSTPYVRRPVREAVGTAFAQPVADFELARDLVRNLEDGAAEQRHPVLIQLASQEESLEDLRKRVVEGLCAICGEARERAEIEPLRRFVAARLTRAEIEKVRELFRDLPISRVWRDAEKRALIADSTHTVQARTANLGYGATGRDIHWAVLDTGIQAAHPHFQRHGNIHAQWDCTKAGEPREGAPDGHGHGTHVAGIIAGEDEWQGRLFSGMAPEARLHIYKVLDDEGRGRDSWIIKALDHIAGINERSGQLAIHGINLSLGGSFDPSVYGVGHSPLCQELRRLWRQGVVVCVAAGNEGYAILQAARGMIEANLDLSIGDPANLEEAIAVGSVHKRNPHTYGVSYFSSRGPTADGRVKPDVVAPGERILSASHRLEGDPYVAMSGTSMATPHVSGILAAFLSVRREFIAYPDRVKAILLENCTDLHRDPYIQGRGLPNLVKMLANT